MEGGGNKYMVAGLPYIWLSWLHLLNSKIMIFVFLKTDIYIDIVLSGTFQS